MVQPTNGETGGSSRRLRGLRISGNVWTEPGEDYRRHLLVVVAVSRKSVRRKRSSIAVIVSPVICVRLFLNFLWNFRFLTRVFFLSCPFVPCETHSDLKHYSCFRFLLATVAYFIHLLPATKQKLIFPPRKNGRKRESREKRKRERESMANWTSERCKVSGKWGWD